MGLDIGTAADVAAEMVVVNEVERAGHHATGKDEHAHTCANCSATLQGAYCHACGQSAHIHRSLLHLIEELLHGVFHFETKAWRTIPALIFSPGKLTRNYIDGQRTRYVSPLALFLFLIFLMFFVFSFTSNNPLNSISDKPHTLIGITKTLQENKEKLALLQAERAKLPTGDAKRRSIDEDISDIELEITGLQTSLNLLHPSGTKKNEGKPEAETIQWTDVAQRVGQKLDGESVHFSSPQVEQKVRHALKTPELTLYKIKSNASKLSFLLMPISLPFLWLLFAFKRRYGMFDHAVFSLYSLSFMALLSMLVAILNTLNFSITAVLLFAVVPPLHIFWQLRAAYQIGIFASLWRTFALLLVAVCSLLFYILLIIILSA
ncbi:DUF3667 domain-containing protein [Undibacterium sp. Di27W]|uniref:DUF3667 domain-containing protein n=1 Tax=Undibacterium sp. Di27W TaxID=3413036 RepID=UPI003BF41359